MSNQIVATPVPTGGAISLAITGAVSGAATLSRAASGQAFTQIYSGTPLMQFVDAGEGLPQPLNQQTAYNYQYTDSLGTATSNFITPAAQLTVTPEQLTQLLIRLLEGGLQSLNLPANISKLPQVTQAMPLGGNIPLPLIVINQDIVQQADTSIGQSMAPFPGADPLTQQLISLTRRVFRVSILALNAPDRDFFREAVVAIFEAIWLTVLAPFGLDVVHRWQVSSGQVAKDPVQMAPGFYFADIMLEFVGNLSFTLTPGFGIIKQIAVTVSGSTGGTGELLSG